jgi:hypothetical protein
MTYDYESDEALAEIHDEMYRAESERPKSGVSQMTDKSRFMIGLFIGALVLLMLFEKISMKNAAMLLIAGGAVLYFMKGTESKRQELTWLECMMRINDLLKFLQKHPIGDMPQVPKGEIHVKPIGRKQWYEGQPFKRSFAVNIFDAEIDTTEIYFVEVDVFTGDIITFRHSPEGVYGNETKDIKLLPPQDMLIQKKRDQFLNKRYKV